MSITSVGRAGAVGSAGSAGALASKAAFETNAGCGEKGVPGLQGFMGLAGSSALGEDPGEFAGFTTTTTTGSVMNGRLGMHALCAAAFPGSHLCHVSEYRQSNSAVSPPTEGAWLDPSYDTSISGVRIVVGVSCASWTSGDPVKRAGYVNAGGGVSDTDCSKRKALACCSSLARTQVAGYTSVTTTGGGGGRPALHQICSAEFPGSHLCHLIEYARAHDTKAIPASGAWLDPSHGTAATSARELAWGSCANWTSRDSINTGSFVSASGGVDNIACSKLKSLACCR